MSRVGFDDDACGLVALSVPVWIFAAVGCEIKKDGVSFDVAAVW